MEDPQVQTQSAYPSVPSREKLIGEYRSFVSERSSAAGRRPSSTIGCYTTDARGFLEYLADQQIPLDRAQPSDLISYFKGEDFGTATSARKIAALTARSLGLLTFLSTKYGVSVPIKRDSPEIKPILKDNQKANYAALLKRGRKKASE